MYVSKLDSPIILDASGQPYRGNRDEFGCGYEPRDYNTAPPGSIEFCSPLPPGFLIPRSEWRGLIEEQERNQATLVDVRRRSGIRTLSQGRTNYCWMFGTTNAARIVIAKKGLEVPEFSPTGAAALIKGFRNVGGNTFNAIPWIARHGIPLQPDWTLNVIDRRFDTPQMRANALHHRLLEWWELPSNNFDAAASCLLRGFPVILGLRWWMHMVCGLALRALPSGGFGIEIENSHGESYGNKGLAVLTENRATAFDQACPRVQYPNSLPSQSGCRSLVV